jgi:hypothetical protein
MSVVVISLSLPLSVCAKSKGIWAPENESDVIFIVQQAGSSSSGGGGDRDKQ